MAAGFMAGFGATMSKLIEEDRQYYRAKAEKRKDYLQTYGTKAVVDIEGKANDALAVANQLQDFGFSKGFVTGITNKSGVRGMYDFAQKVLKRTDLTPDDIKELETSAVDFVSDNPEEDLETVINRAYGLYKSESDPVKRKTGMLGAMLGLDAQALEDQVINADYYGGYSGQDLIRIAASSGPKAGKPLGIKLPPKPLSATEYGAVNKVVNSTFDTSIARQLDELGALILKGGPEVQAAQAKRKELETIQTLAKSDPNAAMNTYLKNHDTKGEFLSYLQGLESKGLGRVSSNFLFGNDLPATFKTLSGDRADDASLEGIGEGRTTVSITPRGSEVNTVVTPEAYTPTELRTALSKGELPAGSRVLVNGNEVVITEAQVEQAKAAAPGMTKGEGLSLERDGSSLLPPVEEKTSGLTDDDMGLPDGPIPKSLVPAIQAGAETTEWIASSDEDLKTALTSGFYSVSAAAERGIATAIDYLTGVVGGTEETEVSKDLKKSSEYLAEQAAEVASVGFTEYWTSDLDEGNEFKPAFPGDVPEGVVKEVKGSYLDAIKDMLGIGESSETRMVNGKPMTDAEILAAARAQLDEAANARIDAGTNIIEKSREEFTPEFPGDVPDNLEEATTESISKALRFLTELPDRIHQSLFDTQDMINASIASLFEETLGERIMKSKGQKNRVVALQALKDKITEMRKAAEAEDSVDTEPSAAEDGFVPRFPGDTRQQQAMVARDNKVEPLVRRPEKPKEMSSSDRARLQRAQKANKLSGDSSLLEMLVKKYGLAIVQKEMGL